MNASPNPPLRVALLTAAIAPYKVATGVGQLYKTLAEGLSRAGHQVTVIGVDLHPDAISQHTWGQIVSLSSKRRLPFIPRSLYNALTVGFELLKRRSSFDVVEGSSWPGLSALIFIPNLPSVVRLITSVTVDSDIGNLQTTVQFALEWIAIRRATFLLASTDYIKIKAEELYHISFRRVIKVPLGIEDVSTPESVKLGDEKVCLLVIAAATTRKGADVLLRALAIVARSRQDFEVNIIGPRYATYEAFVKRYHDLAATWSEVRLLMGRRLKIQYDVSDADKMRLLSQTDYLLITSRSESFGIPVIEAMRSAVTVISSRGGALGEVAGAASTSLFYDDPEDFESLAQTLINAIARGSAEAKLSKAPSRLAYEQYYTADKFVEKTIFAYRRAIASKRRVKIHKT